MNHFISSQASQLLAPFLNILAGGNTMTEGWVNKVAKFVSNEVRHRVNQV